MGGDRRKPVVGIEVVERRGLGCTVGLMAGAEQG